LAAKKVLPDLTARLQAGERVFADLIVNNQDFKLVDLSNAFFSKCRLAETCFAGADLSNATFQYCRFKNNDFTRARLQGATFSRCSGLSPKTMALLESEGAVILHPRPSLSSLLLILVTALLIAALFNIDFEKLRLMFNF